MAPQDSFIDEDDECWYVISRLSTEPPLTARFSAGILLTTFQSPLHRRVRPFRQKLSTVSMWLPGRLIPHRLPSTHQVTSTDSDFATDLPVLL
jgi:hypothetical protein